MTQSQTLKELQEVLHYFFKDESLLLQAITHSSYANERKIHRQGHYERLEFLGDAVLELVTSQYLYDTYPDTPEGKLTKMRASLVCEPALVVQANKIHLGAFLLLGKGEEGTGGRERPSIIADVMESVIGAIYLDGGLDKAKEFILGNILKDSQEKIRELDSKTTLQEMMQKSNQSIEYQIIGETGPDHDKDFEVAVYLEGQEIGKGTGKSKKSAEQQAAREAIQRLSIGESGELCI